MCKFASVLENTQCMFYRGVIFHVFLFVGLSGSPQKKKELVAEQVHIH